MVKSDLMSDSENKKASFYTVYVNFWFHVYMGPGQKYLYANDWEWE